VIEACTSFRQQCLEIVLFAYGAALGAWVVWMLKSDKRNRN
jgi:hypothetical protein